MMYCTRLIIIVRSSDVLCNIVRLCIVARVLINTVGSASSEFETGDHGGGSEKKKENNKKKKPVYAARFKRLSPSGSHVGYSLAKGTYIGFRVRKKNVISRTFGLVKIKQ